MPGDFGNGPVIDISSGRPVLRLNRLRPSRRLLGLAALALAVLVLLVTGYYQVEADEEAIVQRFGAYHRSAGPGPHLKFPFGVESVTKVPVQRQLKMEFGFRTTRPGVRTQFAAATSETAAESLMLTGDLNVAVVEWIVQYRIREPRLYLFKVREVSETFRDLAEATMRQVVGDHSVDEVLTIGREAISLQAKQELQTLCDRFETGIEVQQLVLQDVNPPDPVKPAFNEVNQAIQEKERAINDAWADYNKSVPKARGEAEQAVRSSEGYALERVNSAEGDASRFEALYAEYRKAPEVTRRRLYLENMGQLLPRMGRKVIVDERARGLVPLLQLDETKELPQ